MGVISNYLSRNGAEAARNIHRTYNRLEGKLVVGDCLGTAEELMEKWAKPHSEIEDEYK